MLAFCEFEGDLIAAGSYHVMGEAAAGGIARWDGQHWRAMGTALYGDITDVIVFERQLYALGFFDYWSPDPTQRNGRESGLQRWNGSDWDVVADLGYEGQLLEFQGELIFINRSAWVQRNGIWEQFGFGPDRESWEIVTSVTVHEDQLVVAGAFQSLGGVPAKSVAIWDGSSWQPLGDGFDYDSRGMEVRRIASVQGELYAHGGYLRSSGELIGPICRWNGAGWEKFAPPGAEWVNDILVEPSLGLMAVSQLDAPDHGYRLDKWNGAAWLPLAHVAHSGYFEVADPITVGARSYWGGRFSAIGGVVAGGVAALANGDWQTVEGPGREFTRQGLGLQLQSAPLFSHDGKPGTYADGLPLNPNEGHLVTWDGKSWQNLGPAFRSSGKMALHEFDEGLFCFIETESSPPLPFEHLGRWDGSIWHPLDVGTLQGTNGRVKFLEFQGKPFLAGAFQFDSGESGLMVHEDGQWRSPGLYWKPTTYPVYWNRIEDAVVWRGELIAAGQIVTNGFTEVGPVAAWNGSSWRNLPLPDAYAGVKPSGLGTMWGDLFVLMENGRDVLQFDGKRWKSSRLPIKVYAGNFVAHSGNLILTDGGGYQSTLLTTPALRYDGASWHALPPLAADRRATRISSALAHDGALWIRGTISRSEDRALSGVARLEGALPRIDARLDLRVGRGGSPTGEICTIPVSVEDWTSFGRDDAELAELELEFGWSQNVAELRGVRLVGSLEGWNLMLEQEAGRVVVHADGSARSLAAAIGQPILELDFLILSNGGYSELTMPFSRGNQDDVRPIRVLGDTGMITPNCRLGDLNADGIRDDQDVQRILMMVSTRADFGPYERCSSDLDADGDTDAGDAVLLLHSFRSSELPNPPAAPEPCSIEFQRMAADWGILHIEGGRGVEFEVEAQEPADFVRFEPLEGDQTKVGFYSPGSNGTRYIAAARIHPTTLQVVVREARGEVLPVQRIFNVKTFDQAGQPTKRPIELEFGGFYLGKRESPQNGTPSIAPNPINPSTRIEFTTTRAGTARVELFDAAGRQVRLLHQGEVLAGPQSFLWTGDDDMGRSVASGVYFLRVRAPGLSFQRKLVVVK